MFPPILTDLARAGIKLRLVAGDQLEVTAPSGRLSGDLRDRLAHSKPELVAWLVSARDATATADRLPAIRPDASHLREPFPLSDLQASFLIGSQEGCEFYVRPHQYLELDFDDLDPVRFEEALDRGLARQRANLVVLREDLRLEVVCDPSPVQVSVADLRSLPAGEAMAAIERVRAQMSVQELPLDRWPWLDLRISQYGDGRARLHVNSNNFFSDGPGTSRFLDSVLGYYREPLEPQPELELSYRDCVLALAALEESPLGEASKTYWRQRLAGWPGAPELPLAAGASRDRRSELRRREVVLPAATWGDLKARARRQGLTATNALYAAYCEVLAYWSGSRHFLLNNMVTHRLPMHPQIGDVMGNFAALYPLEVDWRHDEPFAARARRLQQQVISDVEHVHWSGVKVLQELNRHQGSPGRAACPFVIGSGLFMGQLDRPAFSRLETPQVLLDCQFWEQRDGSLWLVWDALDDMFPEGLIDTMLAAFTRVLADLAEADQAWASEAFDLLPPVQREQRASLNRTGQLAEQPGDGTLHGSLTRQAATRADQPAVVTPDVSLTFAELRDRAWRVAELLRARGVRTGDIVAVALPRGEAQVAAVLGVLTAGAAYVPVDPQWPAKRLSYLLADTRAAAVLTGEQLRETLAGLAGVPVLTMADTGAGPSSDEPWPSRQPDDLAYVIYTSGSTGRPKGAMLSHKGPLSTITDINRRLRISSDDVLFGVSSLCFDLSVYDIFGALDAGATLVLPPAGPADPALWASMMTRHHVTLWNSVPALMQLLVEMAAAQGIQFPELRTVLLSGDWIPVNLPERIRAVAPMARVIGLGGATEASIWSICYPVESVDPGWASVPYGKPLAGQSWHVLDSLGRDAPTWVTGELFIGGAGVALGYLGDPARTSAAFVPHPRTGERLYRTGDLGRYLPSGDIEFLGRTDFQVKIQGYRVEPGEIEHALLAHPEVREAAVLARSAGSGRQLASFVVGEAGARGPDPTALREHLAGQLPAYLVPSHITVLDRLPLTANGKIDRKALAAVHPANPAADLGPAGPVTPTEALVAAIWEEVLSVRGVGVHDDFFALGGQSFAALQMTGIIARRLGRRVPLSTVLGRRTVSALAQWLDDIGGRWSPLVRLNESTEGKPAFLVHPAGGGVLCYRELAAALRCRCYGLQAPGYAEGGDPPGRVEDYAAEYVSAVLTSGTAWSAGPCVLAGWSSGAVIAFEMARQFERLGQPADRLVVIDAPAPAESLPPDEATLTLWFLEDLGIGFRLGDLEAAEVAAVAEAPAADQLGLALRLAGRHGAALPDVDLADLAAALATFLAVVRACHGYGGARIATDITVVRAASGSVSEFAGHPREADPDWGWAAFTRGTVTAVRVPGSHHSIMAAGNAGALAEAIKERRP